MTDARRRTPPVREALHNPNLVRATSAYACSAISEWALWVGVLVYAYDRGGAATAGFTSLGLLVPAALAAPAAGAAADGRRPIRVLVTVYALQAFSLVGAAGAAMVEAPLSVVIILSSVSITSTTFVRPSFSVVVPGLVTSARQLTAANLLNGWGDSASVLLGPLIASALLAAEGTTAVFAGCALFALAGTVLTAPLVRLDPPPLTVNDADRAPRRGSFASLFDCIRALGTRPGALGLLAVLGGQYVLIGGLDLLYVILAIDVLDIGSSGPGYLSAAFGVGAFVGGLASTFLVARRRLAPSMLVSLVIIAVSILLLGAWTTVAIAFVLLLVAGISRTVLDLTGRMLMQRCAPQEALASVFAVLEALAGIGMAVGSILVQVVVATSGARIALVALGAFFIVLLAATGAKLRHVDGSADAPVVEIRLLRSIPIFGVLPGPALEGVARAATHITFAAGTTIIAEGDVGDRYFAIVTGTVDVTMAGEHVRNMTRGEGFGEIALLADVARTAAVTATTDTTLLTIERAPFLTAVTGHDASARTAWSVAHAFHPALAETPDAFSKSRQMPDL